MAQPELVPFKRRTILLKPEVTEGVDSVPVGATDGFQLFDGSCSTEVDTDERVLDRDFFGGHSFGVGMKRATIEGEFELYPPSAPGGAADSDAFCGRVLIVSGMAVTKDAVAKTTRYNPVSAGVPTLSGRWNHSGVLLKPLGIRGDISGLKMEIGKRFVGKCKLLGNYDQATAEAAPLVTLPTKRPVIARARNTTCLVSTFGSGGTLATAGAPLVDLHTWTALLSVDFGNKLEHGELTEHEENGINDRVPKFTWKVAKTDITNNFNPWFVRDNMIELAVVFRLYDDDTKDGLYSELAVRGQIQEVRPTEVNGKYGWELSGPCIPTSAGNDELRVLFGDAAP